MSSSELAAAMALGFSTWRKRERLGQSGGDGGIMALLRRSST
jgi:hypothetical protein